MKKLFLIFICFTLLFCASCGKPNVSDSSSPLQQTPQAEYPCDFTLNIPEDREARILQITDTQVFEESAALLQEKCFKYVDYAVQQTNPDLILVTGDIIYGMYDKAGVIFEKIIAYFENLEIPWAPVFGNHDNESEMGADWQCNQLENAKNCMFLRRSELSGNGNYSIGIKINGILTRTIYMLDTKGCRKLDGTTAYVPEGISEEQVKFVTECQAEASKYANKKINGFVALHIMPSFIATSVKTKYNVNLLDIKTYSLPDNQTEDFGSFGAKFTRTVDKNNSAYYAFADCGIDGIFAGHEHLNDASVIFEGVRMTYGVKSSTCDTYDFSKLGGTLITVTPNGFNVEHCYCSE